MRKIIVVLGLLIAIALTAYAQPARFATNGLRTQIDLVLTKQLVLDSTNATFTGHQDSVYFGSTEADNWSADSVGFWIELQVDTLNSSGQWKPYKDSSAVRVELKAQWLTPNHLPLQKTWATYTTLGTLLPTSTIPAVAIAATTGSLASKFYCFYRFLTVNTQASLKVRATVKLYSLKYWR